MQQAAKILQAAIIGFGVWGLFYLIKGNPWTCIKVGVGAFAIALAYLWQKK